MAAAGQLHSSWLLMALLGAVLLYTVDIAVVNNAIPAIYDSLDASDVELQFIIAGYMVACAPLLITGARLGDIYGYVRIFVLGLIGFMGASLACGLAPNAITLVVARLLQGAAAAFMVSQVLTGIQLNFDGQQRARALGQYTLVLAGGSVIGMVLGGLLVTANLFGIGWRPIFLINLPFGIPMLIIGIHFLRLDQKGGPPQQLDLPGVALLSVGLMLLVASLVFGPDWHWSVWIWITLVVSIVVLAMFVGHEHRVEQRGADPLIHLPVLAMPTIRWGLLTQVALNATYFGLLFVVPLYLQRGLGESPLASGLSLTPWVAAFGIAGPVLGRLPEKARRVAVPLGAFLLAGAYASIGLTLLSNLMSDILFITLLGLGGLCYGTQFAGMIGHLTNVVSNRFAADISGLFNTILRTGSVIGIAAFGTPYLSLVSNTSNRPAAVHAFLVISLAFAATSLVASLTAYMSVREDHRRPGVEMECLSAKDPATLSG
jgi:MFS family permease